MGINAFLKVVSSLTFKTLLPLVVFGLLTTPPFIAVDAFSSDTDGELSLEERVAALEESRWSDKIAIHGVLAGAYQGENPSGPDDVDSFERGAIAVQP